MATYRLPFLNAGADIINPAITVNDDLRGLHPNEMTVDVTVCFSITVDGNESKFGFLLDGVAVPTLNYNKENLDILVLEKLEEFIIS